MLQRWAAQDTQRTSTRGGQERTESGQQLRQRPEIKRKHGKAAYIYDYLQQIIIANFLTIGETSSFSNTSYLLLIA